ncbi:hypothetical protein [Proteus faecis]|uniref:hypothetical protein n=1 Tax=Proteus faecis TaxID=2050967 RepID=UPI0013A55776|nr:hypothetical protein [Proteus faecis]
MYFLKGGFFFCYSMSLCRYVVMSLCRYVVMSLCRYVVMSLCRYKESAQHVIF